MAVIVAPPPDCQVPFVLLNVTVSVPVLRGLLKASFSWAVIVVVEIPFGAMIEGLATRTVRDARAGPALKVRFLLVVSGEAPTEAEIVAVPVWVPDWIVCV